MSQREHPIYCKWCGTKLRMFGAGKQSLYCDKDCKSAYFKLRRTETKNQSEVTLKWENY